MKKANDYIFYHYYLMVKIIYGKERSGSFESSAVLYLTLTEEFFIWYILSWLIPEPVILVIILTIILTVLLFINKDFFHSEDKNSRIEKLKKKYSYLENSHKYRRVFITVIITIVIWGLALSRL